MPSEINCSNSKVLSNSYHSENEGLPVASSPFFFAQNYENRAEQGKSVIVTCCMVQQMSCSYVIVEYMIMQQKVDM